jgi:calcium binding protein
MPRPKQPTTPPVFEPGAKVRVKRGVRDPDFPDIPLGGWSGTIKGINRAAGEVIYLIEWDQNTLKNIHPVYRKRCERDGLEYETMALGESDLEPDDGTPVAIEQPTQIKTPPLSEKDQDDRVRMALGLTRDDPLPEVNYKNLLTYHRYFSKNLVFPFKARYEKPVGWAKRVEMSLTVTGLLRPDECVIDEQYGVIGTGRDPEEQVNFPLAEIEVKGSSPSCRMVSDYSYWFHNWR